MKRVVCVITVLALVLPMLFSAVSAVEDNGFRMTVDGYNSTRGTNHLIIFYSGTTTKTNEWGYEVCVDADGKIISVGGNDNAIPEGGFVASAHGTKAVQLKAYAKVGMNAGYFEVSNSFMISDGPILPFYEFEVAFNGINTYRGENAIIVYHGTGTTGTNRWGTEVLVNSDGIVTSIGGYNNQIPEGGFVVSGHGAAGTAMVTCVKLGMIVSYNASTLTLNIKYTIDSLIYADGVAVAGVEEDFRSLTENAVFADIDASRQAAETARALYDSALAKYNADGDQAAYYEASAEIAAAVSVYKAHSCESVPAEHRGVWLRPTETTREDVADTVQALVDIGINAIHIETLIDGLTAYTPRVGSLFEMSPEFGGFDVLDAYITECHARGVELHCWMPVFYTGSSASPNADKLVFSKDLSFYVKNNLGGYYDETGTMMFLDPSNADTVSMLLDEYRYILENYDIDCFQLDYIRYAGQSSVDWGYSGNALKDFKEEYGFSPSYNTSASWWKDWCDIRCGYVTDFVRAVYNLKNEVAPDVLLSADVFSDLSSAPTGVYQDCIRWISNGWIDMVHPMAYGEGVPEAVLAAYIDACGTKCALVPGLGSYLNEVTADVLYEQIKYCRDIGSAGVVFFESRSYLYKGSADAFSEGLFDEYSPSLALNPEQAVERYLDYLATKAEILYECGNITASECDTFLAALVDAKLYTAVEGLSGTTAQSLLSAAIADISNSGSREILAKAVEYLLRIAHLTADNNRCVLDLDNGYLRLGEMISEEEISDILSLFTDVSVDCGSYAATGDSVSFSHGASDYTLTVIVNGDIDCDGKITSTDYFMLKRYVLGSYDLGESCRMAGAIGGGDRPTATDYLRIKRHVLGTYNIFQ